MCWGRRSALAPVILTLHCRLKCPLARLFFFFFFFKKSDAFAGGETIKNIKEQSRAHVELQRNPPPNTDPNVRIFSIRGTPQQLEKARQLIDERIGVGGPAPPHCPSRYSWAPRVNAGSRQGEAGLPWCRWRAGCHQRLNVKNPSNGLNGVHQWLPLPFDLACWLPLNTSVVLSHSLLPFADVGSSDGGQQQLWCESLQPGTGHSPATVKISTSDYFHSAFL